MSMSIGELIKNRRLSTGLSLRDVAKATGLSASYISKIERGESSPPLDKFSKIIEVIGFTEEEHQIALAAYLNNGILELGKPKSLVREISAYYEANKSLESVILNWIMDGDQVDIPRKDAIELASEVSDYFYFRLKRTYGEGGE